MSSRKLVLVGGSWIAEGNKQVVSERKRERKKMFQEKKVGKVISRHETVSSVLLPLAVILSTSKSSQNIHGSKRIYKYARYSIRNMLDSMALLTVDLYCQGIPKKSTIPE